VVLATELERKLAFDLRGSWQAQTLVHSTGTTFAVIMSVLAHNFPDAMTTLLRAVIPAWDGLPIGPYLSTAGKVDKTGAIVANVVFPKSGIIEKDAVLYLSETHLRDDMRRLADRLKLADRDRVEFFTAVKNWVVADRRLDPNLDPRDPDAKRLRTN
jgi:hypothetical protein